VELAPGVGRSLSSGGGGGVVYMMDILVLNELWAQDKLYSCILVGLVG
jgi:hypothetical protein